MSVLVWLSPKTKLFTRKLPENRTYSHLDTF